MSRIISVPFLAFGLIAATPGNFGGWFVVTYESFPEYLEVGQPTTVTFKIRQHGETLRSDLEPTVTLVSAEANWISSLLTRNAKFEADVTAGGLYQATVTPSESGRFALIVETNEFRWAAETLPLRIVATGERPVPLASYDRGQQLFVAKGCATCHSNLADPDLQALRSLQVGPDLTGRRFDSVWLARKVTDPASYRTSFATSADMPALELTGVETSALTHYLNGQRSMISTSSH